jgi:glycosyltransferase involved in cell wall biosynthesis
MGMEGRELKSSNQKGSRILGVFWFINSDHILRAQNAPWNSLVLNGIPDINSWPRMRIALDACCLGRRKTGNETYIRGLLHGFSQLPDSDLDLQVLTTSAFHLERDPRFQWREIPLGNFVSRNFRIIPQALKSTGVDLFHGVYWARWWKAPPYVLTVHDLSFVSFPQGFRAHERWVYANLIREMARRARAVITISEYSKRDICEKWKIPVEKVHVTYLAADPSFEEALATSHDSPVERVASPVPYILFVGNLHPRKNLVRLLEAFVLLRKEKRLDIRLKIVGQKAWLYGDIFETVRKNGIEEEVEFTGYVGQEELKQLYRDAAVMCYPSLFEGFGLPVLEAMWCGCPVVASRATSIPEVTGDAAILVNPLDSSDIASGLEQMLGNSEKAARMREQGLRHAQNFSWTKTVAATRLVYQGVGV